jgi:hypothetical protein
MKKKKKRQTPWLLSKGFHGGDYEEFGLPGCYAVWLL